LNIKRASYFVCWSTDHQGRLKPKMVESVKGEGNHMIKQSIKLLERSCNKRMAECMPVYIGWKMGPGVLILWCCQS